MVLSFACLAGCETSEEEKNRVEEALPEGCVLIDLGQYGNIDALVMITCEGRKTTSVNILEHTAAARSAATDRAVTFVIEE
jgi:hypothetical protein